MLSLRRWRAPHLLGAWIAYWVLLTLVVLGRPLMMLRELTGGPDRKGSANASFADGDFSAELIADGATVWAGRASYGATLAWLVIPPLVLWIAWLVARPRPTPAPERPAELRAPDPVRDPAPRRERAREESER